MQVFDTHCHLGLDTYGDGTEDFRAEHARARSAGVLRMLVVGIDAVSSRRASELARELPGIAWSAGLHPNSATQFTRQWADLQELAAMPGCVAVGETGLDFFRDRAPPAAQEESLVWHAELAGRLGLPLVLHCRDAHARLCEVLRPFAPLRGILHCFSGGVPEAREGLDLGLHLSFAGPLTYPKNHALREAAAFAPFPRVLVETDAPFLPPQSRRGKRNEPAFVMETLGALAALKGVALAVAAQHTWDNAVALLAGREPLPPAQRRQTPTPS
jgi:TatD DNase family protein